MTPNATRKRRNCTKRISRLRQRSRSKRNSLMKTSCSSTRKLPGLCRACARNITTYVRRSRGYERMLKLQKRALCVVKRAGASSVTGLNASLKKRRGGVRMWMSRTACCTNRWSHSLSSCQRSVRDAQCRLEAARSVLELLQAKAICKMLSSICAARKRSLMCSTSYQCKSPSGYSNNSNTRTLNWKRLGRSWLRSVASRPRKLHPKAARKDSHRPSTSLTSSVRAQRHSATRLAKLARSSRRRAKRLSVSLLSSSL